MKRILSVILTIAMLTSLFSFTALAATFELPEGANANNTIRFALIADSHLQVADGATTSYQTAAFERALESYANLGVDALVMAGDIIMLANTDTTEEKMLPEYNVLKTSLEKYGFSTKANTAEVTAGKIPVIYATGNHEFPLDNNDAAHAAAPLALETFENAMGCTQNSHTVIEGVHFITSGGSTYASYLSAEKAQYLMTELDAAKQANISAGVNNPIFLVLHHPIYNTLKGSASADNKYSAEFRAYLDNSPEIIVLSAHTHTGIQEPGSIWQDGFTTVSSGYVGGSNESWSQGYLVEVNGKNANFYKIDYVNGTYIPDPWTVDITDLSTYAVSDRANANAPVFAENAKITVSGIESEKATISWPQATQTATGAYQDNYVDAYTLKVTDANTNETVFDKTFETISNTVKETTSAEVTGLTEYTKYNVEVTAVSPLGNVSEKLTTTFTTLDPALKRDYMVFECEANDVFNYQDGWMNETNGYWHKNEKFSGGVWLQSNISKWTWNFTPEKTGYYRFELSGRYESDKGKTSNLVIGSTTVGSFTLGTSNNSDGTFPFVNCGDSIYLTGGTTYKMTLNSMVGGSDDTQAYIDCFHIFYDDTRSVTTNSINTKVGYAGLYGVDIIGSGSDGAKATVTVSENVNGVANTVTTADAVDLNAGTSIATDKVGIFYMDEGDKTVTVNVTGDYNIEKISVYKMLDVKTYGTHIEAEKYATSATKAFSAVYGDYTNSMFASGLCGANISATYNFTATANQTYRFDVIGAAENTAANVAITVNGTTVNGKVKTGDWKTKSNYIGDIELTAGDYTITLTADNPVKINAIKTSRGLGDTDIYIDAETGFDRDAGHGVGWYDNSPTSIDSNRSDVYKDELGNIELMVSSVYGKDGRLLLLENKEWYRYTIDIPRAGYYRVLGEIHHAQATTPFSITVNDDPANSNTLNIDLGENCTNYVEPFTDCGLLYFNEGKNTLIFKNEHTTGYVTLGALRIVSPDIELTTLQEGDTTKKTAAEYLNKSVSSYSSDTNAICNPGGFIEWEYNAPVDGTYTLRVLANGDKETESSKPLTRVYVDGSPKYEHQIQTDGSWGASIEQDLPSLTLTKGTHIIKLYATGGRTQAYGWLEITAPSGYAAVKTVGEGTFAVEIDVTDWYAGATIFVDYYTGPDIYWNAKDSNEMQDLAVVAAVYEGDKLVNAYFNNEISKTTNATNSKLYDYKITIEDIVVEDGQYVKLFVLDNGTMTPLADYTIYE